MENIGMSARRGDRDHLEEGWNDQNKKIKPTLKFTAAHQVVELHPKILRSPAEVREVRAGKKKNTLKFVIGTNIIIVCKQY